MKTPEAKGLYRQRCRECRAVVRGSEGAPWPAEVFGTWTASVRQVQTGLSILVHNLRTLDKLRSAREEALADVEKTAA